MTRLRRDPRIFVSQGFDSSAPQSQTLLTVHGLVDGLYLEELREKLSAASSSSRSVDCTPAAACLDIGMCRSRVQPKLDSYGRPAIEGVRLADRSEPGADDPENFRALRGRAFYEADRDRPQPRWNSLAATAGRPITELGAVLSAAHFVERAISRRRLVGKNQKDSLSRNWKASLSTGTRE